ncbi:MAG: DNA polymerase III subunit beta [Prevotella sp.]|jgi:DNA polymerase-3 subunit beta|nr:DNA polymerase III subunit beta [Prevotella sp.]
MKEKITFKLSGGTLLKCLTGVSKAVKDKHTLPAYTYFLFEIAGDKLHITGTDLENQIEDTVGITEASGDMSFCVDRSMIDFLKTLPEQPLLLEIVKRTETDKKTGNKTVSVSMDIIYASGKFTVSGYDPEYYEKMKHVDGDRFEIPVKKLLGRLKQARKFSSDDTLRPNICSVFLDIKDDRVTFVSTSGMIVYKLDDFGLKGLPAKSLNIGSNTVDILIPILERVQAGLASIISSGGFMQIAYGGTVITAMLRGRYVNYESVFPSDTLIVAVTETDALKSLLRRMETTYDKIHTLTELNMDLSAMDFISTNTRCSRSARESIPCESNGTIGIGVNASLLAQALSVIDTERVNLSFISPDKVIMVTPEEQAEDARLSLLVVPVILNQKRDK